MLIIDDYYISWQNGCCEDMLVIKIYDITQDPYDPAIEHPHL